MKIAAAQMIRPYRAPQWLVEPRPDGICDADDLEVLNTAGVEVLENHDVLGWPPYNAIIATPMATIPPTTWRTSPIRRIP